MSPCSFTKCSEQKHEFVWLTKTSLSQEGCTASTAPTAKEKTNPLNSINLLVTQNISILIRVEGEFENAIHHTALYG